MTLHNQLLVNGYTNNPIKSETAAVEWMQSLVDSINMKTIQGPYASYVTKDGNRGLTCVVMIETSHIALHIWDEPYPAEIQFDYKLMTIVSILNICFHDPLDLIATIWAFSYMKPFT